MNGAYIMKNHPWFCAAFGVKTLSKIDSSVKKNVINLHIVKALN